MNVVISGPSGVGKGTLIERLKRDFYDIEIEKSISYTTRIPRKTEKMVLIIILYRWKSL